MKVFKSISIVLFSTLLFCSLYTMEIKEVYSADKEKVTMEDELQKEWERIIRKCELYSITPEQWLERSAKKHTIKDKRDLRIKKLKPNLTPYRGVDRRIDTSSSLESFSKAQAARMTAPSSGVNPNITSSIVKPNEPSIEPLYAYPMKSTIGKYPPSLEQGYTKRTQEYLKKLYPSK